MAKIITITYDEQRDALAAGYDPMHYTVPPLMPGESARVSIDGLWLIVKGGEAHVASKRLSDALDCLLGFMERTK